MRFSHKLSRYSTTLKMPKTQNLIFPHVSPPPFFFFILVHFYGKSTMLRERERERERESSYNVHDMLSLRLDVGLTQIKRLY